MKKYIALFLALAMLLSGCAPIEKTDKDRLSVVCTIFPQYDWVRQILGGQSARFDLTLLLNNTDLHNFQPSVGDIVKISDCDLFIYVGGESDRWVRDALAEAANPNMIAISLLDELGAAAKEEKTLEGMPEEDEEAAYDEHVWLSLKNAQIFCVAIAEALSALDVKNSAEYADNLANYTDKLKALDRQYQETVDAAAVNTLLFGDRFPFLYLTEDYGLTPFAAFPGCSAETEVNFETVIFLASKIDQLGLHTILVTENADQALAQTIVRNTAEKNQQILVLDTMQAMTAAGIRNGTDYFSVMEHNLEVLREALQ